MKSVGRIPPTTQISFFLIGGPFHQRAATVHLQQLKAGWTSLRFAESGKGLVVVKAPLGEEYLPRDLTTAQNVGSLTATRLWHVTHDTGFESKVGAMLDQFDNGSLIGELTFRITSTIAGTLITTLRQYGWSYDPTSGQYTLKTLDPASPAVRYAREICKLEVIEE